MLKKLKNFYHVFLAWYGAVRYGRPSERLLVIGITGTSGKSSVIYWLRHALEAGGYTVGSLSTVDFYIAGKTALNDQKMTMLGRMQIQRYLRDMADAGCQIAIVEMTSEGELQHRNRYINTDIIALTNLYPEHIESHGGFIPYKQAKLRLFAYAAQCRRKYLGGNRLVSYADGAVPKVAVVNGDSAYSEEFLQYGFDRTIRVQMPRAASVPEGISFQVDSHALHPRIYGEYNAGNLAIVIAIARELGVEWPVLEPAINALHGTPGRVEFITEAQRYGFRAIVDYAFEPVALAGLYGIVASLAPQRIIHVLGGTGGGRDASRRAVMGRMAGEKAHIVIVTNEDPYDEDPIRIMHAISDGALSAGKKMGETVYEIPDRKEAITAAIGMAHTGDIVLVTGKGSEQRMCLAGGVMIPWDDRARVREALETRR